MKEMIAEVWKKLTELRHGIQGLEADLGKVEKAMAEARSEADTLDAKTQAVERVNKELAEKTQVLAEVEKRLETAQAKINKIKESL